MKIIDGAKSEWIKEVLDAFMSRKAFIIENFPYNLSSEAVISSGIEFLKLLNKEGMSYKEIAQLLVGIGISSAGMWLVWLAIIDPEPTSKLAILTVGGIVLIAVGGIAALRALGQTWDVEASKDKIILKPV